MYANFFGLRELPFNNTPDPRYFFSTPDHEEALASLIYAVSERKGFVLLTGEVGSGKTLIARLMVRHFADRIAFASVNNTQITPHELLFTICNELDIPVKPEAANLDLIRSLQDFLLARFSENRPVVLMLDEAQALSRDAFEQIRMIGNLEADDAKLLQIMIVGQQELRERFEASDMRQLRQRLFRSYHLPGLTREQTEGYIRHRLSVAGAKHPEEIIDAWGIDVIHEYAQGLPRLINTVCDNALLSAYATDCRKIDGDFIRKVISQMLTISKDAAAARRWDNIEIPDLPQHSATEAQAGNQKQGNNVQAAPSKPRRAKVSQARSAQKAGKTSERELHDMTLMAKRLLQHSRDATREARDVIRFASTVAAEADRSLTRLEQQANETSKYAVVCRDVVDRATRRAVNVTQVAPKAAGPDCLAPVDTKATRKLIDRSRNLDRVIQQNRASVEQVRDLIKASHEADRNRSATSTEPAAPPSRTAASNQTTATTAAESERQPASTPKLSPVSPRLAERVRALAALVEESRRRDAFKALENRSDTDSTKVPSR